MTDDSRTGSTVSRPVRAAIVRFATYRICKRGGFATPFFVLFMVGNGVTYTDIALGTSAMAVAMIATEVPSGYLADRLGRRTTVVAGQVLGACGATGYLVVRTTPGVVAMYLAFGLSASVQSGSETAWFYEVLEAHGDEGEYTAIASRVGRAVNVAVAATMLGGAALFLVAPWTAIAAGAAVAWAAVAVALTFPKNADYGDGDPMGPREAARVARRFVTDPAVRTVVLLAALAAGGMYASSKYVQPTTLDVLPAAGPAVAGVTIPPAVVLAGVYAVLTAAGGVVTGYGDRAEDRLGVGGTVVGAYGTAAACMVVPLVAPALALPAMVGFLTLPSLAGPAKSNYLNERTDSVARATTLSAVSFVNSLVRIPVLLAGGVVADAFSPTLAMAAVGAAVLGVGGGVVLVDRPLTTPVTARGATAD